MKNIVFIREILHIARKHGNSVAAHAHKVHPFFWSQTNSALKITSAISVHNFVKIGEECKFCTAKLSYLLYRLLFTLMTLQHSGICHNME